MNTEQEVSSGLYVDLADPDPALLTIKDIATHLAGMRRFLGHSPVSVAEHSMIVSDMVRDRGGSMEMQFAALMHDAHEAYLGDISRPMKELIGRARMARIISRFDTAICTKFGISYDDITSDGIKFFDDLALHIEAHWFMASAGEGSHWRTLPELRFEAVHRYRPKGISKDEAEANFIEYYNRHARVKGLPFVL